MKQRILDCTCAGLLLAFGCNDFARSETGVPNPGGNRPTFGQMAGRDGSPVNPSDPSVSEPSTFPAAPALPTDTRPVVSAATPPPPISGGTLLVSSDGVTAIATDPDRDRIAFVDLQRAELIATIDLEPGDEPGRLAEDGEGRIHVALRGAGELATVDIASRTVLERRPVCSSPRGVAYDRGSDAVHVACLGGELATLPAAGGRAIRNVNLGTDLRDVVMTNAGMRVTRFKSAEVLEVDGDGEVLQTRAMRDIRRIKLNPFDGSAKEQSFSPALARRAVAMNGDSVLVLHERELNDAIELEDPHAMSTSGAEVVGPPGFPGSEGSAYGGSSDCSSIVQGAVSVVDATGKVTHSMSFSNVVLPVDVAISNDGRTIAVADAGQHDINAPARNEFFLKGPVSGGVTLFNLATQPLVESEDLGQGCMPGTIPIESGQPTAVAFTPDGTLVVQSRQPAQISIFNADGLSTVDLGGEDRLDTGHEIFHRDAGAGIACASCHGEGGDDGHVWNFSTLGPRRTQSINVGLEGTAPFHWSGDMADLTMLMREVFVDRMGGVPQSGERVDALSQWLFAQQAPAPPRAQNDESALRGKELFESKEVGCGGCHTGSKLTNNQTVDVGTGEPMQVPSLVGVAFRAPFIHTGCAPTLRDRFDPACGGGDKHGKTSQLDDAQLDDLVAYLETL